MPPPTEDAGRRSLLKAMAFGMLAPFTLGAARIGDAPRGDGRATFCLVHGSTQGPGGWGPFAAQLRARGHRVLLPSLPYGDAEATTADCAGVVVDAIEAAGDDDVRVVAHSISGLVLPHVARSRRVGRLVYVAAAVPQPGKNFREQFEATPDMHHPEWIEAGRRIVADPDAAIDFLYHDCAPDVVRDALTHRIGFAAARLWTERFDMAHPAIPTGYVVCLQDRVFTTAWMRRAARERLRVEPVEIDAGHCPYLSQPGALADRVGAGSTAA